jgi:hypothetical protein
MKIFHDLNEKCLVLTRKDNNLWEKMDQF